MRASFKVLGAAAALMLALGSQTASAGWYSARGSAPIVDGDVAAARRNAIDDALRNATLQAGVDVSIDQSTQNGVLIGNSVSVKSRSPARQVRVIEEQENGKLVTVLIKALIDESLGSDCYAGNIRKNILPLAIRYADAEASSSAADIPELDGYINDMLYYGISQSPTAYMLPVGLDRLQLTEKNHNSPYNLEKTLDSLSKNTPAQFLIVGSITSAARSEVGNNSLTRMFYNPTRTIRFNVKVYDLYAGVRIFDRNYEGDAEWTFDRDERVNLRSDRFNSSDYGQRLRHIVNYAVAEVVSTLRCRIPKGRIIQLTNDAIRINLGSNANIKEGMHFNIIHRADYTDRHKQSFFESNSTNGLYKVTRVAPDSAWLKAASESTQVINVMLDDIAELTEN